jgi:hypothetical protein
MLLWLEQQVDAVGGVNPRKAASRITVPVLLIGGAADGEMASTTGRTDDFSTSDPALNGTPAKTTNSPQ